MVVIFIDLVLPAKLDLDLVLQKVLFQSGWSFEVDC